MRRLFLVLPLLLALNACSDKQSPTGAMYADKAPQVAAPEPAQEKVADKRRQYLAYQHSVRVETEEQKVATLYQEAQAACEQAAAEQCVVLQSSLSGGKMASASLRLRAKPAGIRKLMNLLGGQGTIVSSAMNAEDLASPIEDSARKLAMLADYRTRLESLRGQAGAKLETLIQISRELAQVQSEIEAKTGERAYLMQRVETEVLNININALRSSSSWSPVSNSLSNFSAHFSEAVSSAITFVAYLIPFGIVLLVCLSVLRWLWLRWRKPRAKG